MPALLCVPILVQDEPTALADAQAARDAGADIIEFRVDEFFTGATDAQGALEPREVGAILRLVAASPLPCIITCRCATEGGHFTGEETARAALYERIGTCGVRSGPGGCRGNGGRGGASAQAGGRAGDGTVEHPPTYLDFEHSAYARSSGVKQKIDLAVDSAAQHREAKPGLILSMHDFEGRPTDLWRRVAAMQEEPAARIVKVAITARSVRDNLDLFDLLAEARGGMSASASGPQAMIALGMGRFGLMSRVLAGKFGGFLTFASLRPGAATAPGQPTVRELVDLYRFRSVTARTRVFGLIGWPVEHSLSPLVHNAAFETLAPDLWDIDDDAGVTGTVSSDAPGNGSVAAFDGVYVPLPVPAEYEHFKATLSVLIDHPRLDFCGCSITLPHKQHLVRFAREMIAAGDDTAWTIDPLAEACGAGNTLVVERDRAGLAVRARVMNTDAGAAVGCLNEALAAAGGSLAGSRVLVLGAGGVARAVAAGALSAGADVVVHNRTAATAEVMVGELAGARAEWSGRLRAAPADSGSMAGMAAVVNCTPVGMAGGTAGGESPLGAAALGALAPGAIVMDTVYTPLQTPLLVQAAARGLKTVDGLEMFVRQAGEQFAAWTGHPPPLNLFRRVCRETLG